MHIFVCQGVFWQSTIDLRLRSHRNIRYMVFAIRYSVFAIRYTGTAVHIEVARSVSVLFS